MKKLLIAALALLSCTAFAQTTHTFTFGKFAVSYPSEESTGCATFQTLDGQPSNQAIGFDGGICVIYGATSYWGLQAPQSWGYPNNGDLTNNVFSPSLSAPVFSLPNCNLQTVGCIYYEDGTAYLNPPGQGIVLYARVWFQVESQKNCGRLGCKTRIVGVQTNGDGTVTDTNTASLYRCGSNRHSCFTKEPMLADGGPLCLGPPSNPCGKQVPLI